MAGMEVSRRGTIGITSGNMAPQTPVNTVKVNNHSPNMPSTPGSGEKTQRTSHLPAKDLVEVFSDAIEKKAQATPEKTNLGKTETATTGGTETAKTTKAKGWSFEGLKAAFAKFTNFLSSIFSFSPKEVAKQSDEEILQHLTGKTDEMFNNITQAIKDAPEPLTTGVATKDVLAKLNNNLKNPEQFGKLVNDLTKAINDRFDALDPIDGKVNLMGKSLDKDAFIKAVLTEVLQDCSADLFCGMNAETLDKLADGLDGEAKAVGKELGNLVAKGQTALGSIELFGHLAKEGMRNQGAETFLRQTSQLDVAAVRKIVFANGGAEFQSSVSQSIAGFNKRSEVKSLDKEVGTHKLGDGENTGFKPKTIAKVGNLGVELANRILSTPIPPQMTHVLKELSKEIAQNPKYPTDGAGMTHRLFSDQIILKGTSTAIAKIGSPSVKLASDMINTTANGIRDQIKYSLPVRDEFQKAGPKILDKIEDFLVKAGMETGVADKTWTTPGTLAHDKAMNGLVKRELDPKQFSNPKVDRAADMTPGDLTEAKERIVALARGFDEVPFDDEAVASLKKDMGIAKNNFPRLNDREALALVLFSRLEGVVGKEMTGMPVATGRLAVHMLMRDDKPENIAAQGVNEQVRSFYMMPENVQVAAKDMWSAVSPVISNLYDKLDLG